MALEIESNLTIENLAGGNILVKNDGQQTLQIKFDSRQLFMDTLSSWKKSFTVKSVRQFNFWIDKSKIKINILIEDKLVVSLRPDQANYYSLSIIPMWFKSLFSN